MSEGLKPPDVLLGMPTREQAEDLRADIRAMRDENTELRKLARDYESLAATLCNERECVGCPFDSAEHLVCEHMRLLACLGELGVIA